jgi:hypothetical protein
VKREALDELKQHIPLLEYLQAHDWQPARALSRGRWMGLCPLHTDHKPSFLVDPTKMWNPGQGERDSGTKPSRIPGDSEHDSGLKSNGIPVGSRTVFGGSRNGVRLEPE